MTAISDDYSPLLLKLKPQYQFQKQKYIKRENHFIVINK